MSNEHDPAVLDPAPVTYTADDTGTPNLVTLTSTGTDLVFDDTAASPVTLGLDAPTVSDCAVGATPGTVTCPVGPVAITLGTGDDTATLGDGLPALTINGREGSDTVSFASRTAGVTFNLDGTTAGLGVSNVENVTGSPDADTITGDAAPNIETGGAGNDSLKGEGGDDTLDGGAGINTLRGGDGDDTLKAGDDGDTLVGGLGLDTFVGGAGADEIVALDGVADKITCGAGDNVTADLGANNVSDEITNPDLCASISGSTPAAEPRTTTTTVETTPLIVVPAIGAPAIKPILAPGKADFKDLTPPTASMRSFTRQRLKTVATKGVPIRVSCQEACGISVALSVDRKTARRLKLDTRTAPVVIATATAKRATAGTTTLRVKFLKRVRPALKRSKRAVKMSTQVLVSDASGNGTLLSRRVTLVK